MFLFQISSYDDPTLYAETTELLRQRLEAHSRLAVPVIWKATDRLNFYSDKEPGWEKRRVRYRVYGILLSILGIFTMVPGFIEPRSPALIITGGLAITIGVLQFSLIHKNGTQKIPASCKKDASVLLDGLQAVDWLRTKVKIAFDETGMTICSPATQEVVLYSRIERIFETEHLWLLIYHKEKALLLQKKDLVSGRPETFLPHIIRNIDIKA